MQIFVVYHSIAVVFHFFQSKILTVHLKELFSISHPLFHFLKNTVRFRIQSHVSTFVFTGRNPVTGAKLDAKQLIKLNFHKNSKDEIQCPITFKVFTESSHIVAIRPSGNVYSYDAIDRLNIKTNTFNDLMTNEPFTRDDIITIQDPKNLDKFNIQSFAHLKNDWKLDDEDEKARRTDPNYFLKSINHETAATLQQIKTAPSGEFVEKSQTSIYAQKQAKPNSQQLDHTNMATYSTGRLAASFTSTSMDPVTVMEAAVRDENEIRYARIKNEKKKGYARLVTNLGVINIELDCDLCPQTCENFIKHCADKYYVGTKFHRSIKNFIVSAEVFVRKYLKFVYCRFKVVIQLEPVRVESLYGINHFVMNAIRNYNIVDEAC